MPDWVIAALIRLLNARGVSRWIARTQKCSSRSPSSWKRSLSRACSGRVDWLPVKP